MADPIICGKTREAIRAYIIDAAIGIEDTRIYDGRRSGDKGLPNVKCHAMNAEEEPAFTGNFWVNVEVSFRYAASVEAGASEGDPEAASLVIWRNLTTALGADDLPAQLSAFADDFTCQGYSDVMVEEGHDDDAWVQTWKARLYCSPSDL